MKFVAGVNGRNPEKNLPRLRFDHRETHMEWARRELEISTVGGERLTACATKPPLFYLNTYVFRAKVDWDFRISDLAKKNPDGTDI